MHYITNCKQKTQNLNKIKTYSVASIPIKHHFLLITLTLNNSYEKLWLAIHLKTVLPLVSCSENYTWFSIKSSKTEQNYNFVLMLSKKKQLNGVNAKVNFWKLNLS